MDNIKLQIEDATMEVFARIVKAEANKYDCSMDIDFQEGRRKTRFIGEPAYAQHILQDVKNIFYGTYGSEKHEQAVSVHC